jgi:hypothetical protein
MAINILHGGSAVASGPDDGRSEPLVIGEPDTRVFICPSCARPLATGSRRCAGCGLRLLLDVPAAKATALLSVGLAVGLVVGGVAVAGAWAIQPTARAIPVDTAVAAPTSAPAGGSGAVTGSVPAAAAAALRGTVEVNARMTLVAAPLAETLAARPVDTSEIARQLRRLSTDVRAAEAFVPSLDRWPEAEAHASALQLFYLDLGSAIRDALSVSIRSESVYQRAGHQVLALLGQVAELDAAARAFAEPAGVTLPAVTLAAVPSGSKASR